LQAAAAQGVIDKVTWGSSSTIADDATAKAAGSAFDGKIAISTPFKVLASTGPDENLYRQITKTYAPGVPLQYFGQLGYLMAKFATNALLSIKGPVTAASYNDAVVKLKNQKSDLLCKPWYFGHLPFHIPVNWSITVTYRNGQVVQEGPCSAIPAVDQELSKTRAFEKKYKLDTG
jgi:branched-chain amino acid transport system substrate-binding protein